MMMTMMMMSMTLLSYVVSTVGLKPVNTMVVSLSSVMNFNCVVATKQTINF